MMNRIMKHLAARTGLTLFILVLLGSLASAQPAPEGASKIVTGGGYEALAQKISGNGRARIIVQLNVPFRPFADPESPASLDQRGMIRQAQDRLLAELSGLNAQNAYRYQYIPAVFMEVDEHALQGVLRSPLVSSVQEDKPEKADLNVSVPLIGANSVWTSGYKGSGVAVAVLDTGVDKNHPHLTGAVVSEACYSTTNATYNSQSVCPGGVAESTSAGSALPYAGICPSGECDHGTHVSGIVAGREGQSISPGVAPQASIIAIQVFSRFNSDTECGAGQSPCALTYPSDQIKGLERVYALRSTYTIAAANMSLGSGSYTSNCDAQETARKTIIDQLRAAGIATVISSGNSGYCGSIGTPACISSAVSVGATDDSDNVGNFSNSSSLVHVFAPGVQILSSLPNNGSASWDGTSMAAPHVAGAWALIKHAQPGKTVDQVLSAFQSTGVSVTDAKCTSVTKKRINVNEALASFGGQTYTLSVSTTGNGTVTSNPEGISCGATCSASFGSGQAVSLSPTPDTGWVFSSWGGACSGSGACSVTMDGNKSVSATFVPAYTLTVNRTGNGTVSSNPAGISCGATCSAPFGNGQTVTLSAIPDAGWAFSSWGGACSGSGTACSLYMDASKGVSATFVPAYTLTVTKAGTGTGTVTPDSGSLTWAGNTGTGPYAQNTVVVLTAAADAGSVFDRWSGEGCSGTGTCTVTMSANRSVIATFRDDSATKTVNSSDVSKAIPDNSASGVDSTLTAGGCKTLYDVNVAMNITHTYVGDLKVKLTHNSSGKSVELFNQSCSSDDNLVATFDDEAPTAVQCPPSGRYVPASPLSMFDGINAAGTWTLNVSDNSSLDTGTLNSWGIVLKCPKAKGLPWINLLQ